MGTVKASIGRIGWLFFGLCFASLAAAQDLAPLIAAGHPVHWWFVFKLNAGKFPGCAAQAVRACPFGGEVQPYTSYGQQYVFASNEHSGLSAGEGCTGDTTTDPVGATFAEVYDGSVHYVVWNDQFYQDPQISDRLNFPQCNYRPQNLKAFLAKQAGAPAATTTRVPTGIPC